MRWNGLRGCCWKLRYNSSFFLSIQASWRLPFFFSQTIRIEFYQSEQVDTENKAAINSDFFLFQYMGF
jgi:hypothetical protein